MPLYQSRNRKFSVEVAADGAIQVRRGDWLSKYSAAMYNDLFCYEGVFGRLQPDGGMQEIVNHDLIREGETLYHIPTWFFFHEKKKVPEPQPKPRPPEEVKRILEEIKKNHDPKGDDLAGLEWLNRIAGLGRAGLQVVEIFGLVAVAPPAAGIAGLIGAVTTPIAAAFALNRADNMFPDFAGVVSVGYTTAAFAWGERTPPSFSAQLQRNGRDSLVSANIMTRARTRWNDESSRTVTQLQGLAGRAQANVDSLRAALQISVGPASETKQARQQKLFQQTSRSLIEKLSGFDKRSSLVALDGLRYPG